MEQAPPVSGQMVGRDFRHAFQSAFFAPGRKSFQHELPGVDGAFATVAHSHGLHKLVDQDVRFG